MSDTKHIYNQITLRKWQKIYKDPLSLIVQASKMDGSDSWQPFPIGMQYSYINNYKKQDKIQIGNHDFTVLTCFNTHTDSTRRPTNGRISIQNTLLQNNIINKCIEANEYFDNLPNYKFVISPEGNGIDCHRHYEALIAGCIPIIEDNAEIRKKYEGCPILYTKDYSEITNEYLLEQYKKMIDYEYDFSKLFLSYYDDEKQKDIKTCGNYWTSTITGVYFYKNI
uniref:RXYLT1 C-terminal domain-containing protein n=1 Tax=viral metagenome TaxID=1070528 RepID=A0A6C0EUQ3_9ZZZZ